MSKIIDVIVKDRATYYQYDTGKISSARFLPLVSIALALALSYLFGHGSSSFLSGVLSAQSILVGFGFNVLLYLSTNPIELKEDFDSIEDRLMHKRLQKLSDELIYNVSYFNIVGITSVALSLMTLCAFGARSRMTLYLQNAHIAGHSVDCYIVGPFVNCAFLCISALLYFSIIESVVSFARVVGRVVFLVERIRGLTGNK